MDTAKVNGVELEYEVQGAGEPVLLISTGPIADSFVPLFSERTLAGRFRLIRYRQRRMGSGARGQVPVHFEQHAADAAALLDHLGVRRAHVAGHSTGAVIALQLAARRPELVHTLALLEPTLVGVPSAAAFLPSTAAVLEALGPALAAYGSGDREEAMAAFLGVACNLDRERCLAAIEQHVAGGVAQAMSDGSDNWFGSYLPALNAWQFSSKEAAAISQPVLSVLGTQSGPLFEEGHALLHFWFPQAEDCMVEGVAHLLHLQRPEPVAQGVSEFFARHPMAPS
ncbi:MAG TPA: alpha/beta hydrolase [Chloroflexota bacterium]|nr:alpha/beta hydrolase [Chloroflexota bacterium]